jgi:hypothetical protein
VSGFVRRRWRRLAAASAIAAIAAVLSLVLPSTSTRPVPAANRGPSGLLGHPEGLDDAAAVAGQYQARASAPYSSVTPGAYNAALAQAQGLPSTSGAWQQYGRAPECAGQSTSSSICPIANSANGQYSQTGSLGFRGLSGRVTSLAGDPANPNRLWASPAGGGVWESDNGGDSWRSIGDSLPTQVVGAIAYDAPRHTLLVGTGDNSTGGGDAFAGHGFSFSNDDGRTWHSATGVPDLVLSYRVFVSPADPSGNTVYFASSEGLYRSTTGGRSFVNEQLPTSPPGYSPNCAGATTTPMCHFANWVTDVVVTATATPNAPAGAVMAVVGWRAGQQDFTNPDGSPVTSCRLNGAATACTQSPRNGIYLSRSGSPGTFAFQDQGATAPAAQGFAPDPIVGRTALGIAEGHGQNPDAVYALVEDATKMQGCPDVLDAGINPVCQNDVTAETEATFLDGMYATYDFGHTWTKIMDYTQTKYPGTNSALIGQPGYSPGVQSWYNLWVQPDPTQGDSNGNPTRVLFGLEEVWENNSTVPGVLTDPWQLHQTPAPGVTPWRVVGRYWNACAALSTGVPCNPDLHSSPTGGSTTHPDQHAVLFVPDGSGGDTLYVGSDGGVFRQFVPAGGDFTNDGWGDGANIGLASLQPYDAEMAKDGTVVSGLQDNGELKITPNGQEYEIFGGDGFMTTIDPNNSQNIMEEYTYGSVSMTNDGGASWFPQQTPSGCSGSSPVAPPGALFDTPLEQDPTMPGHIIEGCNQIEEVSNGYANPCQVPPGANASTCQSFNIAFNPVFSLGNAPSGAPWIPSALGVRGPNVYVGFCGYCDVLTGGQPFASGLATNVGGSQPPQIGTSNGWHILDPTCAGCGTPDGKLPQRYITSVQIDPSDPNTVYATMGGYGRRWLPPGAIGDTTQEVGVGHVFVSHDAGRTFTNVSGNLPEVPADWTVLHAGHLVVATDIGVFVGDPKTGRYSTLGTGLPQGVQVLTLRVAPGDPNEMLISTYGRGDWIYRFPAATSATRHAGASSHRVQTAPTGGQTRIATASSGRATTGSGPATPAAMKTADRRSAAVLASHTTVIGASLALLIAVALVAVAFFRSRVTGRRRHSPSDV